MMSQHPALVVVLFLLCVLIAFSVGVIIGCLIYSGRNDCICSDCRREKWRLGMDVGTPEGDRAGRMGPC